MSSHGPVPLETLIDSLQDELHETVVDKTGLTGMYQFSLEWSDTGALQLPTLETALEQSLGLRLEKSTRPFDVLVIDHIEKAPARN